jgi:hypothetical protein
LVTRYRDITVVELKGRVGVIPLKPAAAPK